MTRPIDETWRVYNGPAGRDDVALEGTRDVILESAGFTKQDEARARLAAQAPAALRLLKALEWTTPDVDDPYPGARCPQCDGRCPAEGGSGHSLNCELAKILRAAGVVEP